MHSVANFCLPLMIWFTLSCLPAAICQETNPGEPLIVSHLPILVIDTLEQPIKYQRITGKLSVIAPTNGTSQLSGPIQFQGHCEFWVRGSSTRTMNKKPYRLEIQDESGDDLKIPLLGLPKESDWILHAAYNDHTFIRDCLAYDVWQAMGYYSPRTRYIDLFIRTNHSSRGLSEITMADYQGVYILTEKIKRGKDRLNIEKLQPKDNAVPAITGGYIFKIDSLDYGEVGFKSSRGIRFVYEEPKEQEVTSLQAQWLTNFMNGFEKALFGDQFTDKNIGYNSYIVVDTFIDYHWLVEISRNIDGYFKSIYLNKDRGGKLRIGPPWDWDMSFGNPSITQTQNGNNPQGWLWEGSRRQDYLWYERLFEDPDFLQRYIDRWHELRTNIFATSNLWARIDKHASEIGPALERNFHRWQSFDKSYDAQKGIMAYYRDKVEELKQWIKVRLEWIDSQDFPPPKVTILTKVGGGMELSLKYQLGRVFYTTDGTDPRVSGGGISPRAKEYKSPLGIAPNQRFYARVRSDDGLWSALAAVQAP